jgi:hypothetical protein
VTRMHGSVSRDIEKWEDEGGATGASPGVSPVLMTGTSAQVELAQRIQCRVNADFDRVAASFRAIADRETGGRLANTEAMIEILEDKRSEVMRRGQAGYFIRDWQEIGDQVRRLIVQDSRFQALKDDRSSAPARRPSIQNTRKGVPRP